MFFQEGGGLFSETETVFTSDTSATIYGVYLAKRDMLYQPAKNSLRLFINNV